MTPFQISFLAALASTASGAGAQGVERAPWLIQAGVTRLAMADDAVVSAGGAPVPGAGVRSDAQVVPSLNVTRFVSPALGVSLAAGLPPRIRYAGTGTLAPAGALLDVRYAAPAVTLLWSPLRTRAVSPYVGAGVTYVHVLSTTDRALAGARVEDDAGPVLQGGVSLFPRARVGAFIDVKKAYVRTIARGHVGGIPAETRLRMDPVVVQAGIAIRL